MTQPPKPLFDRLPAVPARAAKPDVVNVGREEAARKRLKARIGSASAVDLLPPGVDPRCAAVSALMVANFVYEEPIRKRLTKLAESEFLDANAIEDLPVAARLVLRILQKLGPDLDQRPAEVPPALAAEAGALRERLIGLVERFLSDSDDANGRLTTVRLGEGLADTVFDLRMLAAICRDHGESLEAEGPAASYTPELERAARETAQRLEDAILGPLGADEREWRAYVDRAVAMLVPLYDEVCRAGRFLFPDQKPEAHFPTLASVARVRRRLRREATRRIESAPAMPAVRPPSAPPVRSSIPPEASLVDVSTERERALAGAIEAAPPPAPLPVVASAPAPAFAPSPSARPPAVASAPSPAIAPAPAVPSAHAPAIASAPAPAIASAPAPAPPPSSAAAVSALEAVSLDFGGAPRLGEDADADLESPDLELDVTFTSESNFYTDVFGEELGLFIATFVVKPVGTPLAVRLTVPLVPKPFVVRGTIAWVLEFSPSIEAPPGIGLKLEPIAPVYRRAVDAFMKVRAPILHDE